MTNKQSWEKTELSGKINFYIGRILGAYENTGSMVKGTRKESEELVNYIQDYISKLLTSKSEQMEREKKNTVTFEMLDNEEAEVRNYEMAFNAGISACQEILKK